MFSRMDGQKMAASVGFGACSAEPVTRVPIGREKRISVIILNASRTSIHSVQGHV